jgi:hypothetical protein
MHAAAAIVAVAAVSLTASLAPRGAFAQPAQNAKEAVQDRAEMARDRAQLADDVADVRRLERLLLGLDEARAKGDRQAETVHRNRIRAFLNREIAETRHEVAQDRREVKKSAQELRSERREVRRDRHERREARATGSPAERADAARDLRRDRRDLRDDRRDLRDDARDAAAAEARLAKEKELLLQLRALQPDVRKNVAGAEARERALLEEFLALVKQDARATAGELSEDRRELREDRRERRDDRRERREGN